MIGFETDLSKKEKKNLNKLNDHINKKPFKLQTREDPPQQIYKDNNYIPTF